MTADRDRSPNLINPWTRLPRQPPYVLSEDAAVVDTHNRRRREEHRFRLDTLPEPYLGSVDAPIVLLNLNPGFHVSDLTNYGSEPRVSIMRESLVHALPPEQAFYFLTHEFKDTGGWNWWHKKLTPLIQEVGLERVRRGLQVIEYVPYKSERFYGFNGRMPSQAYSFYLAQQAVGRGASVVAMRRSKDWISAVPGLAEREPHVLNSVQNVTISPRNCPTGFGELVEKLQTLS